ncbi:hypothetical protein BDR03DRAFT_987070 [Suillus americanus]|nr:hypothetical protein BDR03DRAFT_987070 [Suillus americanus]
MATDRGRNSRTTQTGLGSSDRKAGRWRREGQVSRSASMPAGAGESMRMAFQQLPWTHLMWHADMHACNSPTTSARVEGGFGQETIAGASHCEGGRADAAVHSECIEGPRPWGMVTPHPSVDAWVGGERLRSPTQGDGGGNSSPKRGRLGGGFRREASVNARRCEATLVEIPHPSAGGERKRSPMRGDGGGNSPPKRGRLGDGFRREASVNARRCEATVVEIPHPSVNALVREIGGRRAQAPPAVRRWWWQFPIHGRLGERIGRVDAWENLARGDGDGDSPPERGRLGGRIRRVLIPWPGESKHLHLAEEEMQHGAWLDPVRNGRRGHDGVWYIPKGEEVQDDSSHRQARDQSC